MKQRLQKLLAQAGVASRRRAEDILRAGRVSVNGRTAHLGQQADPEKDAIRIDGRPLPGREKKVYLMLNKPRGYVTTVRDEQGRKTVMELLEGLSQRVYPVGRLDLLSEGLLLLTNDGAFAHRLLHPSHGIEKTYWVTVAGDTAEASRRLEAVRKVDGLPIRRPRVTLVHSAGRRALVQVVIGEGRNRQIRKMCAQCGLAVLRLRRVGEGSLSLGDLAPGAWRHLTEEEVAALFRG